MPLWVQILFAIGGLILFLGCIAAYGDARYMAGRRDERKSLVDRGWRGP